MGPLYPIKDLVKVWNEFFDRCNGSVLDQSMSKDFIKATRDAIVEKAGSITVSAKEQKRVQDETSKLRRKIEQLSKDLKSAFETNKNLREEIEKLNPRKTIWWHWIMDQCRNEKCSFYGSNVSQGPVHDDLGEDINLFNKVNEYNERQRSKETDYRCDGCGAQLKMMHRHASADWNCIVDENDEPIRREPLIKGQEFGSFLKENEFANLCNAAEDKRLKAKNTNVQKI